MNNSAIIPRNTPELKATLRKSGLRITKGRVAILRALLSSNDHPTAEELLTRARAEDSSLSLATIYRTLSAFEEQRVVQRNIFSGGGARFEVDNRTHHDHLIDIESGQVIEFFSEKIEQLQQEIAEKLGYEVLHHRLELYGRKKK